MLRRDVTRFLLIVLATLTSVGSANVMADNTAWTRISVFWNNGSLPPPHRRSGSLVLEANGQGTQSLVQGYHVDAASTTKQDFVVAAAKLAALSEQLRKLKAFSTRWQALEPHPVGGSMRWLRIETASGVIEIPPFPIAKQRERAAEIIAAVKAVVPALNASEMTIDAD
ncbi:hypothetical protein C7S18_09770 [Ahniella affigens]|uniref:Uncharacterized protein n=2 Tax=Ahniella affigens TaxID=2021234 RepID=A0A2P1PRI8_9GAMM|nr:hypothetical protein C7S18_09770 [Ahniella affigens]